ncbi:Phosphate transport system permease protein PstC [Rubellimicrobium mesophilum DSM 19309]|uniref:Phosphate transport system permease protein n=1 Tax=Rubellimicrobium mesophilum DSM 19309 TaxID=442562 RepID=A0A017HHB6_9RHOB|nr:phosphate ABC transporter permease subunit PstC [Rubellimicrobium mesophilum]EYD73897.1 Phosphate transport system permease protein PstC [Rubellimicrobium mesophilum DSM 19309]
MPAGWLLLLVLLIAALGYGLGRRRALVSAGGNIRVLHSLPAAYGWNVAMAVLIPSLLVLALWSFAAPRVIGAMVVPLLGAGEGEVSLLMGDVRRVAEGLVRLGVDVSTVAPEGLRERLGEVGIALGQDVSPATLAAAARYDVLAARSDWLMTVLVLAIALGAAAWTIRRTTSALRARNEVERGVLGLLVAAALVAIATTVGIVLALISNTIKFFGLYPATDFFFGTTWSPSFGGGSELGILPLVWGTLYISAISLLVAVPLGLLSAIYLSEYASPRVRAWAKPMLEVLAGIPSIVYGLFALLTVGPALLVVFGDGGLGIMQGGTAVITAGLVMGIMLIPFVSSLSDDIINAVPQAIRDGSLGLGATPSETIRQVVIPAALPGIMGAILLAASRAIGETMIVVLGAGAAARLSLNPFDAMTTITAKIVSQLTGDSDFNSPEALVAFALGMTLFVVTLALNVLALWIVRRYREQYE